MRSSSALLALVTALAPTLAQAQGLRGRCGPGQVPVLRLGITGLECSNCTLLDDDDARNTRWEFRAEPVILGVDPDGPAADRLRAGDIVVSIDGHLITTLEGGRRIARPDAGRATVIRVRREGREIDAAITPTEECRPGPTARSDAGRMQREARVAIDSVVVTGQARTRVRTREAVGVPRSRVAALLADPRADATPPLLPTGRLGMSFSCSRCGVQLVDDSVRVWRFPEPPVVTAVEAGGPSAQAGIRVGDRIVSIDGDAITSEAGGRRFGTLRSGEQVRVGIRRGGEDQTVELTTGVRAVAGVRSRDAAGSRTAVQPEATRFTGRLGDTMINVTGEPVVVTETETEIIIRSRDITVRLRRDTSIRR